MFRSEALENARCITFFRLLKVARLVVRPEDCVQRKIVVESGSS